MVCWNHTTLHCKMLQEIALKLTIFQHRIFRPSTALPRGRDLYVCLGGEARGKLCLSTATPSSCDVNITISVRISSRPNRFEVIYQVYRPLYNTPPAWKTKTYMPLKRYVSVWKPPNVYAPILGWKIAIRKVDSILESYKYMYNYGVKPCEQKCDST